MNIHDYLCRALLLPLLMVTVATAQQEDFYEIGGPLAGLKLPLMPTEQGEAPGFPGCIEELAQQAAEGAEPNPESGKFMPQGNNPARELRPGSPELYLAYMDKYMPVRSFFDRQSLVKTWEAKDLSSSVEQFAAPLYWVSRHGYGEPTGRNWSARPVVRTAVKSPVFELDAGELPVGLYCVKVLGAVESEYIESIRRPLYIGMKVNDGVNGEISTYRRLAGYVDEFYSIDEIYFHVPAKRKIQIEVFVDDGSMVPLLVHNIELHNALAGTEIKAIKQRPTLFTEAERQRLREQHKGKGTVEAIANSRLVHPKSDASEMSKEERFARDALIWKSWIPINSQCGGTYGTNKGYGRPVVHGADGLSPEQIAEQHGEWQAVGRWHQLQPEAWSKTLMTNKKLDLSYTMDDLTNHRALPDPYPFKDDGTGVYTPADDGREKPQHWAPISEGVYRRGIIWTQHLNWIAAPSYHYAGNKQMGRDAAMMLIRLAYDWPTFDAWAALNCKVSVPGGYGRDLHARQRKTTFYNWAWYTQYHLQSRNYDWLYDLIQNDQELASSVSRFVPWVKSPEDVIALLDAYLLRTTAKRILRYNWHTGEMKLAMLATIQDNRKITDPWMEWLFTRTWVYPLPPSGIADLMVTGCGRNGPEYIASSYYGLGESAMPKAMELEPYINNGGNRKFNLSDTSRYPKPVMMCYWPLDATLAGRYHLRIGDVAGPDKGYGYCIDRAAQHFKQGWKWTENPIFAWLIRHEVGRSGESDKAWQWIEETAKKVDRAPWLTNPSRAVPQWASILESGRQHDDYRFRRAVYLRTGMGWGHHHNDSLDLQVYAHGLPMTVDGGQRPGYSKPADRSTRMHNLVEIDGLGARDGQWLSHSWTKALTDSTGAQYMHVEATPPSNHPNVKFHRRQVALIDVDEGKGSRPLSPKELKTGAKLPEDIVTANSYIFDVVRVSGGKRHTYCFHAGISDEVTTNASNVLPFDQADEQDKIYTGRMAGERSAGNAPDHFVATWRMRIENENIGKGEKGLLAVNYNPNGPRKFTRLHLLGIEGQRVLRGSLDCIKWKYRIPMAFIQKRGKDNSTESAYAAVIEPYAGDPILKSIKRIAIADNESDAQQAAAIQIETRNGHHDICFADGRPEKTRSFEGATASGEYAYLSTDDQGLRQATLAGGTLLKAPGVTIALAQRERQSRVVDADYATKTITLDGDWPMLAPNRTFEIGIENHWTTYTAVAANPRAGKTEVTVRGGADFYLSRVKEVDPETNTVFCALGLAQNEGNPTPGIDQHWIASNEAGTKFWRAQYLGGNRSEARYGFKLDGPAAMEDFGRTRGFRLWEYGVGDTARQSTFANLRRIEPDTFELTADADVTVTIGGKEHRVTLAQLRSAGGAIHIEAGP